MSLLAPKSPGHTWSVAFSAYGGPAVTTISGCDEAEAWVIFGREISRLRRLEGSRVKISNGKRTVREVVIL